MPATLDQTGDTSVDTKSDRPSEPLAQQTIVWLATLPEQVRPSALPVRFPHMVNTLCRRWGDGYAVRAYLDDLLIDNRGNRQGLPDDVADELATLKDYYETVLYPVPQTVWDEVAARGRSKR